MNDAFMRGVRRSLALAVAAGLLLAVFRVIVSIQSLESGIELYAHGAVLPTVFHGVLAAVCVVAVIAGYRAGGQVEACNRTLQQRYTFGKPSGIIVFSSVFTAFMLLAYALILLYGMARENWHDIAPLIGKAGTDVPLATAIFTLLLPVSAIPASIFFFRAATVEEKTVTEGYTVFSVMPILWFVFSALHMYFASGMALNSPVKVIRVFAILTLLLYAVHEARLIVGVCEPRIYYASGYLAIVFVVMQVFSELVLRMQGRISAQDGYIDLLLPLFYVVYIIGRMLSVVMTQPLPDAEPAASADASADAGAGAGTDTVQ